MPKSSPAEAIAMLDALDETSYTPEQLQENYNKFLDTIKKCPFTDERKQALLAMYAEDELGYNLILAPASGKVHFHLAYPGGYMDHILNVMQNAVKVKKLYAETGGTIDFTDSELLFAAMHHDLGKLGEKGLPYYIENEQDWSYKRGVRYNQNPDMQWMDVTDRALFQLQHYGVKYTWKEMLGIKLADGMYFESNHAYLKTFDDNKKLKTTLPHIIHWADNISTQSEYDKRMRK